MVDKDNQRNHKSLITRLIQKVLRGQKFVSKENVRKTIMFIGHLAIRTKYNYFLIFRKYSKFLLLEINVELESRDQHYLESNIRDLFKNISMSIQANLE